MRNVPRTSRYSRNAIPLDVRRLEWNWRFEKSVCSLSPAADGAFRFEYASSASCAPLADLRLAHSLYTGVWTLHETVSSFVCESSGCGHRCV